MIEKGKKLGKRKRRFPVWMFAVILAIASASANAGQALAEPKGEELWLASDSNGNKGVTVKDGETTATASNAGWEYGFGTGGEKGAEPSDAIEGEFGPGYETEERLASGSNAEPKLYLYEGNGIFVSVLIPEDIEMPEDARLLVTPIDRDREPEQFEMRCREFKGKWSGDAESLDLYDIGFYTKDGGHVEVCGSAIVSFDFGETPLETDGGLMVVHFKAGGPEILEIMEADTDGERLVTGITFRTEGFSEFAFVKSGVLPITGGPGTKRYAMAGALLLLGAGLLYRKENRRKGGRRLSGPGCEETGR